MSAHNLSGGRRRLRSAGLVSAGVFLLTALGGLVLFLAGSLILGADVMSSLRALPAAPPELVESGPVGVAAWMCLLMALGSPIVAAAVFAMLYLGEPAAN